jgi:hypothetical protein
VDPTVSVGDITLVSNCGINVLDLLINESKSKIFTAFKILWAYLFKKKPKSVYSLANPFVI